MKTVSDRKTFSENPVLYIISVFFVIGVYFFWTQNSIQNLDYIAINGTFQNYNVIRRLLAGQIPFVEYTVYLGTGHLLISSVLTFLLGNNYAASVLTYEFLSSLSVVLLCYGFSAVRFPKNWIVPSFTALCIRFFSSHQVIESMLAGGNSARNIRAMIMPVCMLLYLSISGRLEAHKEWSERKMFLSHLLLLSGLSGLSLI